MDRRTRLRPIAPPRRQALAAFALAGAVVGAPGAAAMPATRRLRYGGDRDFPPFDSIGADGVPRGFQVDLLREIAAFGGFDLSIELDDWPRIVDAFAAGGFDVVAGVPTPERAGRVLFTRSYAAVPFAVAFDQIPDAMLLSERESGTVVDVNDAMCRLLGTTREALIGRPVRELPGLVDPSLIDRLGGQLDANGAIEGATLQARGGDGGLRTCLVTGESFTLCGRAHVFAVVRDGRIWYRVADNGVGFDASSVPDLFVPFQRLHAERRHDGLGIGLAVAHRIVRRHGGEIALHSAPRAGTVVEFALPPPARMAAE